MSTSIAYLSKRLADIGRHDLLAGAERGEFSYLAAAEWAGLVTRRPASGGGSQNAAKRRAWALAKVERCAEALDVSQERANRSQPRAAMPDLAAAIAEWEEAQRPAPSEDLLVLQRRKVREPAPAPIPPGLERIPFPAHPAIPCTRCDHAQAAAALREVLSVYLAVRRGEPAEVGNVLPRACCRRQLQGRPDIRALIA